MKTKVQKLTIVGVKELRHNLDEYIAEIRKGRSFTVVRRSKPVFKISPIDTWGDEGEWETVIGFGPKGMPAEKILRILKKIDG